MPANGTPHNYPFSGPAHNTRSQRSLQEFSSLENPAPVDSESRIDDYTAAASYPTATTPASPKHRHIDSVYAPPVFHGRSLDDALDFLRYVERFSTYKEMTEEECLQFIPILLRDAASDFNDSLDEQAKSSWQDFRASFLAHFGKSDAIRWRDASSLFIMAQEPNETAQDFITRVTRCAKHIPTLDDTMIQYAILQGLKLQVRAHVLQAKAQSVHDILQAAKVADVAVTLSTDPNLNQLLSELRVSNAQHAKYQQQFNQLNTRLNQLNISAVDQHPDRTTRSRTPSPRRMRFDTRPSSPPAYRYNNSRHDCFRCGKPESAYHNSNRCFAQRLECFACHKTGHVRAVCNSGRRGSPRGPRI